VNAFIIGAGFTKSVFPNCPLNDQLLEELIRRRPNGAANALRDKYDEMRIEVALTKFDCDNPDSNSVRRELENELGDYFSQFCASDKLVTEQPWLAPFITDVFKEGDVVTSLNYDCVFEGLLDWGGKWTPRGGYGTMLTHPLLDEKCSESPVRVLKIHGSASFTSPTFKDNPSSSYVGPVINGSFFPRSGKNLDFGWSGAEGPYVIAPSYVKVPKVEIAHLMLEALRGSAKANKLIIIGSALRKEDSFLSLIVTTFLHDLSLAKRKIIIVDPHADSIGDKLKNYWGVKRLNQIVPVAASLQHSVTRLAELISD
jgi:hypothetical protein